MPSYEDAETVGARVKRLLASDAPAGAGCDVVLRCAGGEALFAHSLVLALQSPVLHGALAACTKADAAAGTLACTRPPAFEVDLSRAPVPVSAAAMRLFLGYCYAGSCAAAADEPQARELLYVAARFGAQALRSTVEADILRRFISRRTACSFLVRAGEEAGPGSGEDAQAAATPHVIRAGAHAYVLANAAACFGSDAFLELSEHTLAALVQDDALSIREEDLFRACLTWADVQAGRRTPPGPDAPARKKVMRSVLLAFVLPHVRLPLLGMRAFARIVVPADVLPSADVAALLAAFSAQPPAAATAAAAVASAAAPPASPSPSAADGAAPPSPAQPPVSPSSSAATAAFARTRFSAQPRSRATGSVFCFHAAPQHLTLSPDARTLHFPTAAGAVASAASVALALLPLAVTDQAFSTGQQTVFLTVYGVERLVVGVVVSQDDTDDGDCAAMAAENASADSPHFEGLEISASGGAVTMEPHTHRATFTAEAAALDAGLGVGGAGAGVGAAGLQLLDGDSLSLQVDCDTRRLDVTLLRPARKSRPASSTLVASLTGIPFRPLRIAVGARPQAGASDLDGVKISSSLAR